MKERRNRKSEWKSRVDVHEYVGNVGNDFDWFIGDRDILTGFVRILSVEGSEEVLSVVEVRSGFPGGGFVGVFIAGPLY